MVRLGRLLGVSVLAVELGCNTAVRPSTNPVLALAPCNETTRAIWRAVLETYAARAVRSEGDLTLQTNRTVGHGEQSSRAPIVLMTRAADQESVNHSWTDDLVRQGILDGICEAAKVEDCSDSVMTSFLNLNVPTLLSDSVARVTVLDAATNPAACRRKAGALMGGFMNMRFELVKQNGIWNVVKKEMESAGTTFCGFSPQEEARIARLEREDSLLRQTTSPVAGTYQVTVVFGSGDSSTFYTRTELHPMSSIRHRHRRDVVRDDYQSIVGYYLATCSAASLDSMPATFSYPCLQSYYAVSISPIINTADSSIWRGEVDPLVEVTFLDSRSAVREQAHRLFGVGEELRDSDWYFMPGIWVTHRDGRVRHYWTITGGSQLAYRVRADRISSETLRSHSR